MRSTLIGVMVHGDPPQELHIDPQVIDLLPLRQVQGHLSLNIRGGIVRENGTGVVGGDPTPAAGGWEPEGGKDVLSHLPCREVI